MKKEAPAASPNSACRQKCAWPGHPQGYSGEQGYSVETALNGEAAWELFENNAQTAHPFEVVVTDISIKSTNDGLDLIQRIRAVDYAGADCDPLLLERSGESQRADLGRGRGDCQRPARGSRTDPRAQKDDSAPAAPAARFGQRAETARRAKSQPYKHRPGTKQGRLKFAALGCGSPFCSGWRLGRDWFVCASSGS